MAADPISGGIEAASSLIGGIIGAITSARNQDEAREAMRRASQAYNIPLPVLQQMVTETMGPSAMEGVHADPNLVGAQNDALAQFKDISDSGGMTLEDRTNNELLQRDAAQRAQAQRQSITNVLARSGQAPGAVSAALQLGAQRDQQETGALAAAKTAGDARRRAIEATLQRGKLAGDVRQQGFSEGAQRASAADRIAQYNAQAKQRTQQYNLGLPQQNYENQMSRARGQAGVQQDWAGYLGGQAQRERQMFSDAGSGVGKLGAGIYGGIKNRGGGANAEQSGLSAPVPFDEDEDLY